MPKFRIEQNPTFAETVSFRQPGGKVGSIRVDFKYFDADGYQKHFAEQKGRSDAEIAESIASGWDAEDEFGLPAIERLFRAYPTAAQAFFRTFREAIHGQAEKN